MKKPALIFFGRPLFRQSLYDYLAALFGPLKFSLSFKTPFTVLDISKELTKEIAYLSMWWMAIDAEIDEPIVSILE